MKRYSTVLFWHLVLRVYASLADNCTDDRPQVWLGYATSECDLTPDYCAMFGLDFVCQADYNDGDDCLSGPGLPGSDDPRNVLCASPHMNIWEPTPATTLNVLAYNIWELRYLYYQSGQRERTCRIPQEIFRHHGDIDVIIWNEIFMGGCFPDDGISIVQMLNQYGFNHHTTRIGEYTRDISKQPENGGIFISSRWPILEEEEWIYKHRTRSSPDTLSSRGAAYAKIRKSVDDETMDYHILGTHLQAHEGDKYAEARALQAKEMHSFMVKQNIPLNEPVIYGGDLNTDMYTSPDQWDQVLQILEADMPPTVGPLNITDDNQNNDVIHLNSTSWSKWIDYVIYSNQHLLPNNASQQSIKYTDSEPFEVCMSSIPVLTSRHVYPYELLCRESWPITDLSDHYAVLGRFDFTDPGQPTLNPTPSPLPDACYDDRPSVWLGRATLECELTPAYCDMFGLEYLCSADYEIWDHCHFKTDTGKNVRCAVPQLSISSSTPVDEFKVLTYNVWELAYLYYQSGQRERTCRMLTEVFREHADVDVISFNEAFIGGCFPTNGASFRQILDSYGFKYFTDTVGDFTPIIPQPENGGVFIASRWPIVKWEETVYEDRVFASEDMLSAKGAIYAKIEKSVDGVTAIYHVLGTQLQSGKRDDGGIEVRRKQVQQMHNLMINQSIPFSEPVIYTGDFSTDLYEREDELTDLLAILEAEVPDIHGEIKFTIDRVNNDINAPSTGTSKWNDYVLYSFAHLIPTKSSQEAVKYTDSDAFPVCMDGTDLFAGYRFPYDDECGENKTITDLSDHYAVLGTFHFTKEEVSSAVFGTSSWYIVMLGFLTSFIQ